MSERKGKLVCILLSEEETKAKPLTQGCPQGGVVCRDEQARTRVGSEACHVLPGDGICASTPLRDGLRAFAQWYAGYYGTVE